MNLEIEGIKFEINIDNKKDYSVLYDTIQNAIKKGLFENDDLKKLIHTEKTEIYTPLDGEIRILTTYSVSTLSPNGKIVNKILLKPISSKEEDVDLFINNFGPIIKRFGVNLIFSNVLNFCTSVFGLDGNIKKKFELIPQENEEEEYNKYI